MSPGDATPHLGAPCAGPNIPSPSTWLCDGFCKDVLGRRFRRQSGETPMASKDKGGRSTKKAAGKNLKEKRTEKKAKRDATKPAKVV